MHCTQGFLSQPVGLTPGGVLASTFFHPAHVFAVAGRTPENSKLPSTASNPLRQIARKIHIFQHPRIGLHGIAQLRCLLHFVPAACLPGADVRHCFHPAPEAGGVLPREIWHSILCDDQARCLIPSVGQWGLTPLFAHADVL